MAHAATSHKTYAIEFDEATEEWKCGALAIADASLRKLKLAIDREGKKRRRVNVEVFYLRERWRQSEYQVKKATIVLLRDGDRKADIKIAGERGQSQVELDELYSLDQKSKLDAYVAAKIAEEKAQYKSNAAYEALNSLTAKAVREAVTRAADR